MLVIRHEDKSGNFWQGDFIGKDGLEKQYNDDLTGENGSKIIETDAVGKNIFGKYCRCAKTRH